LMRIYISCFEFFPFCFADFFSLDIVIQELVYAIKVAN
jgi:hypothetical protein